MVMAQHRADTELTVNTPELALMGELRGVYCEYFGEN